MANSELCLAMLISGGGTTMNSVLEASEKNKLPKITPVAVISSRSDAKGIDKAKAHNIPTYIVEKKGISSEEFGDRLFSLLKGLDVDLVSQNGWLPRTPELVIEAYKENNMIINQHPGPLDPGRENDFGGKGMYGARVTCARIAYLWMSGEDAFTESVVHAVTSEFDKGDLISVIEMSISMPNFIIDPGDLQKEKYQQKLRELTLQTQTDLLPLEHKNVIATLKDFGEGTIVPYHRNEPLVPESGINMLKIAKQTAINLYPNG